MTTARKLRILAVVPTLGVGGAERVLINLSSLWSADGHAVMLATLGEQENQAFSPPAQVELTSLRVAGNSASAWEGAVNNARRLLAIGTLIEQWKPDVVVGFTTHASVLSAIAAARQGIPSVVTERNYPPTNPIGRGWSLIRRHAYRRAALIVMQTDRAASWAGEHFDANKVVVVPNPLSDAMLVEPSVVARPPVISWLGRLAPVKRPLDAIGAFAVGASAPWRLQMIGDGPLRAEAEAHAVALGVADRVDWLGVRSDVSELLRGSAIALTTSETEGFPNALLEAMASGCAVVSTDCPAGPMELLGAGAYGLLAPVRDVSQIGSAVRTLIESPELRRSLGLAARQRALEFSPDKVRQAWEACLQRAVG